MNRRSRVRVQQFVAGTWQVNCYVVALASNAAFLVDSGGDPFEIKHYISSNGLEVKAILHTHGHFDHIDKAYDFRNSYGSPVYLHSDDNKQLRYASLYKATFKDSSITKLPVVDFDVKHVPSLDIDSITIDVLETPGHTEGSVCYYLEGYLFTGDTLLRSSVGRTDLMGGNRQKLKTSLQRLSKFPHETVICPGHGEIATLGQLLADNDFLMEALHGP